MQSVHRADNHRGRKVDFVLKPLHQMNNLLNFTSSPILSYFLRFIEQIQNCKYHFDKNSLNAHSYEDQQDLLSPEFVFVQLDRSLPSLDR